MTKGDGERVARATLMRVAEPGVSALACHVASVGAGQALADIRAGQAIAGADMAALNHRLQTASGEDDLRSAARAGARLVTPDDAEWPTLLENLAWIGRESLGLWVCGGLPLDVATERSVAIVGTRTASDYGVHVASEMAAELADQGWTVVSGLAFGIDGAAHRGALAAAGLTIAVLACGIDVAYPRGHRGLYDRICSEGMVVTEHPPGAAPQRHRFLVRNRIIAALSLGTVVVEMAARSGAKSTALHATALNRHVMCVPGPVTSPLSAGCHQFLRDQPEAVLVTRASEVVEQCGHLGELAEHPTGPAETRDALGPTVARVLEGVPVRRHAPVPSIARAAGVSVEVASAALAALTSAGLVECVEGAWAMTTTGRRDRTSRRAGSAQLALDAW